MENLLTLTNSLENTYIEVMKHFHAYILENFDGNIKLPCDITESYVDFESMNVITINIKQISAIDHESVTVSGYSDYDDDLIEVNLFELPMESAIYIIDCINELVS